MIQQDHPTDQECFQTIKKKIICIQIYMIFRMKPSQVKVRLGESNMNNSQLAHRPVLHVEMLPYRQSSFTRAMILKLISTTSPYCSLKRESQVGLIIFDLYVCLPQHLLISKEKWQLSQALTFLYLYQIILFNCFKMFKNRVGRSISGCSK